MNIESFPLVWKVTGFLGKVVSSQGQRLGQGAGRGGRAVSTCPEESARPLSGQKLGSRRWMFESSSAPHSWMALVKALDPGTSLICKILVPPGVAVRVN